MSAIKAWFENFDKKYLSINLNEYENIGMNLPVVKLLLIVAVAFIVAVIIISYSKSNLYLVVKQLMRHGATGEENAKTLGEMRLADNKGVRRAIVGSAQMRSIVAIAGEKKMTYEEYLAKSKARREEKREKNKNEVGLLGRAARAIAGFFSSKDEVLMESVDLESARFYIKEEGKNRASRIYNSSDISPLRTVLCCVLIGLFFLGLMLSMPEILDRINSALA